MLGEVMSVAVCGEFTDSGADRFWGSVRKTQAALASQDNLKIEGE